jgi:gliding motility-associated-like protein
MFKSCLFFISITLISFKNHGQNTIIPDNNFEQALIDLGLDTPPLDDQVLTNNIIGVTNLDLNGKNIQDLTGIEDFLALSNLDCSENLLTKIDVSALSNLKILWCYNNQLTALNVSQNINLTALRCEKNRLISLNTSNNINLVDLACEENLITNLNVSNNLSLSRFQCGKNLLSTLDLSKNSNLSYLACQENQLTELNLTNNSRLSVLFCFLNLLTELDLSQNSSLTVLECSINKLCSLNIKNGNNANIILMDFDPNPDLVCVVVDDPFADHSLWEPTTFSNYVNSEEACSNFIEIDTLDDFIGKTYTLPIINNGNYYTASNATGIQLNAGDIINTSQTIYIYNEVNCNSNESSFNVVITDNDFFVPKFFTPNNDGFYDVWTVLDNTNSVNYISIYNRQGKLIKFLAGLSLKWDGTFNGIPMNSDSYWYEIVLNSGEILRGYFALKR